MMEKRTAYTLDADYALLEAQTLARNVEEQGILYVPAALRRHTHQISAHACRVRVGARQFMVFLRGVLLGTITEGQASCYFRARSGRGRLFPTIEALDAAVAAGSSR